MAGKPHIRHPFQSFIWVLGGLLLLLILLEGWRYSVRPQAALEAKHQKKDIQTVAQKFSTKQKELLHQTHELAATLQTQLEQQQPRRNLYKSLGTYTQFWGTALFQVKRPIVWAGFSLEVLKKLEKPPYQNKAYVKVYKAGNVLLWLAHDSFQVASKKGPIQYHLFTTKRIRQDNLLSIGQSREMNLLNQLGVSHASSAAMAVYEKMPSKAHTYRILRSLAGDSVGTVYAKSINIKQNLQTWHHNNQFWRALFVLIAFVAVGIMFYQWVEVLTLWKNLLLQLIIIITGWVVFHQINIAGTWLPQLLAGMGSSRLKSYQVMSNFMVDGLFFFFTAVTIKNKLSNLKFRHKIRSFMGVLCLAVATGLINVGAILFTLKSCYQLAYKVDFTLLSLHIIPAIGVFVLYICLGLVFLALTAGLLSINNFVLYTCKGFSKLVTMVIILSFTVGLFVGQLFIVKSLLINWIFISSAVYFGLLFFISLQYYRISFGLPYNSALRNAAIYSLLISLLGSTVIYQAYVHKIDSSLKETLVSYTQNSDQQAEKLTRQLLTQLKSNFDSLTKDDINHRQAFLQTRFTHTIDKIVPPNTRIYSFDLQLVNARKQLIADYSTNLNSPEWIQLFDLHRLKSVMDIQQITKRSARPIIQQPTLENADQYRTFYRGWLPIFGASNTQPIAWILCSVYQVRPNFNRPIRAVMASLHFYDWQTSYAIQKYNHKKLISTTYRGERLYYPVYNVLQGAEIKALQQDSILYYSSTTNDNTLRNLLTKTGPATVVKTTTKLPGYQNILFSFFRMSFIYLVVGFLLLMLRQFIHTGSVALFEHDERFQYRILDSFLLAALIFLILLVIVTHHAIKQQNKEAIKQQLIQKLDPIAAAVEARDNVSQPFLKSSMPTLDSLATTLNTDASFYRGPLLTKSTTPQIYQQHLLPASLSYPVYSDLYIYKKQNSLQKVTLNRQELLIGYHSVLSKKGYPMAAVAIPTFIQSPRFNRQLLQTTSYLIILYLVVFGLFIIGTIFITRELTRPLYVIQRGLNKISRGDLDTTIPVTRKDEIGRLAMAYNTMVVRLQDLQDELAATEREAAWQEMAQQVAHEIKNPLTPMKLSIQHLERQLAHGHFNLDELKEKVQSITKNLIRQIQSLNHIASDFKKFSKPIDEADFKNIDINTLITSVASLYKQQDQIISTRLAAEPSIVRGIKEDLHRVMVNLLKNALEATQNHQAVTIKTYIRQQSVFVEIEDQGEGIKEEDKPKIFVPNFSTKSGGTGLGLAICKKVIEQHHGNISFASISGKGTTFIIKLPLSKRKIV